MTEEPRYRIASCDKNGKITEKHPEVYENMTETLTKVVQVVIYRAGRDKYKMVLHGEETVCFVALPPVLITNFRVPGYRKIKPNIYTTVINFVRGPADTKEFGLHYKEWEDIKIFIREETRPTYEYLFNGEELT